MGLESCHVSGMACTIIINPYLGFSFSHYIIQTCNAQLHTCQLLVCYMTMVKAILLPCIRIVKALA